MGNSKSPLSSYIAIQDSEASLDLTGICNDGSDVSFAPIKMALQGILMGTGKLHSIKNLFLEVALKKRKKIHFKS